MSELCLGPDPTPRRPRFAVPAGATDCHAHIIGPPETYPYVPERSYTTPPALLADYQAMHAVLGIMRAVIVQPSVHGTDNRVTLDGIAGYGPAEARGVAVVDADVTDKALSRLHAGGIRGVRLNVLFGGGVGLAALEPLARRIRPLGWHIQLLIDVSRDLVALAPRLRALGLAVVVDHMGYMNVDKGLDHPGFQALRALVRDGVCWAKLSGNYRIAPADGPRYRAAIPFAKALIDAGPTRMVWGTDWPHPALTETMPNDGDLIDALDDYAPDAALKRAILVDNPARLYGFA